MAERDEVIFRQIGKDKYSIDADFNQSFVDYIKGRVPRFLRSYDEETRIWTFTDDGKRLNALTSIAAQKFRFAQLQFRNADGKLVIKNLKTGHETVQEE